MNTKHNSIRRATLPTRPIEITHRKFTNTTVNVRAQKHTQYQTFTNTDTVQNHTLTHTSTLSLSHTHSSIHIHNQTITHTFTYAEHIDGATVRNENEQKLKNKLVKMYCIIDKSLGKFTYIHWARSEFNVTAVYSFSTKWMLYMDDRAEYNIANNWTKKKKIIQN